MAAPQPIAAHVLATCRAEFASLKRLADAAVAQCSDEELRRIPAEDGNSVAVTLRHLAGNLRSRWTDFLTSDGEKPWRDRDREFEEDGSDRAALLASWEDGWATLFRTLDALAPED